MNRADMTEAERDAWSLKLPTRRADLTPEAIADALEELADAIRKRRASATGFTVTAGPRNLVELRLNYMVER